MRSTGLTNYEMFGIMLWYGWIPPRSIGPGVISGSFEQLLVSDIYILELQFSWLLSLDAVFQKKSTTHDQHSNWGGKRTSDLTSFIQPNVTEPCAATYRVLCVGLIQYLLEWHDIFQRKLVECGPAGWGCPAEWSSHWNQCHCHLSAVLCVWWNRAVCVRACAHAGSDGKGVFTGRLTCRYFSLGLGPPEAAWIVLYIYVDDIKYWIGKAKLLHDLCSLDYEGLNIHLQSCSFDFMTAYMLLATLCNGPACACVECFMGWMTGVDVSFRHSLSSHSPLLPSQPSPSSHPSFLSDYSPTVLTTSKGRLWENSLIPGSEMVLTRKSWCIIKLLTSWGWKRYQFISDIVWNLTTMISVFVCSSNVSQKHISNHLTSEEFNQFWLGVGTLSGLEHFQTLFSLPNTNHWPLDKNSCSSSFWLLQMSQEMEEVELERRKRGSCWYGGSSWTRTQTGTEDRCQGDGVSLSGWLVLPPWGRWLI